ncbi:serine hydrolase domain-containing protein [soil metagenome]
MDKIAIALLQIDDWIDPQGVAGAAATVWSGGDIVAERYAGEARPGTPVDEHTLFALASVTKPVTAATAMALISEGRFELDDPVADLVPEFRQLANAESELESFRESITVRQLLCHTSGLPEDLKRGTFRRSSSPTMEQVTNAMCALPLEYQPGTQMVYSNAGYAILGRLIERATSDDFWDVVWRTVLDPMTIRDTIDRPGPALDERIAIVQDPWGEGKPTESYNSQYWRDLGLPWGGLFGSARDLVRFAGAFLASEETMFPSELMREMVTDQLSGLPGAVQSLRVHWPEASWGLGWEVKGSKRKHWTGELTSPATFCHFGAAGTLLWAEPEHDLALAVFANRTTIHLWPFEPPRWARLSNSLISAVY